MNQYMLTVVREEDDFVFFNMFVNGNLVNLGGFLCMNHELFDLLFKDLFRSSRGNCIKAFCPPRPS